MGQMKELDGYDGGHYKLSKKPWLKEDKAHNVYFSNQPRNDDTVSPLNVL